MSRAPALLGRERVALVCLAASGAVILPGALNRFVFPKLAVVALGVALGASVPPRGRLDRRAVVVLTAGSLVLVAAAIAGATPLVQLLGRAPRYEGAIGLAVYLGAGAAGARLLGPRRAGGSTAWFLDALALAALLIALEAVLETVGLRPLVSTSSRPGSLLGNASEEGAWAVLALGPLTAVALRVGEPLHVAGMVAAGTTLVCSGSRGALAGGVVACAVLAVRLPRPGLRAALAAVVVALAAGVFLVPATRTRVSGASPLARHTASGRLILWGETARLVGDAPGLGVGPGGYIDAIPAYHDARYERDVGPATPPDSPHDWLLQAAAAGGIPLLVLALALAGLTARAGLRTAALQPTGGEAAVVDGMLSGLAGYGTALLFFFTAPGATPLAAVMGGALLARDPGRAARTRFRLLAAIAFGALTVVLALAAAAEIPLREAVDAAARGDVAHADEQFALARTLRPWDPDIDAQAAHAFAALATVGVRGAAARGEPWARRALGALPASVEVLTDAARIDLATGRTAAAAAVLARARNEDPANPDLRAPRGAP